LHKGLEAADSSAARRFPWRRQKLIPRIEVPPYHQEALTELHRSGRTPFKVRALKIVLAQAAKLDTRGFALRTDAMLARGCLDEVLFFAR